MGLCHEFGTQIRDGCDHPMHANPDNCSCPECEAVCKGLFEGCPDVWERGPQPVTIAAGRAAANTSPGKASSSRSGTPRASAGRLSANKATPERETTTDLITNGTAVSWDTAVGNGASGRQPFSSAPSPRVGRTRGPVRSSGRTATGEEQPRSDVIDWFGDAFEGLRLELHSLATGMTQQEAMVAELLDTRQGELRLVLVAEALPDLVADAVRQAMADHLTGVSEAFDTALGMFRQELKRNKKSADAAVEALRESVNQTLAKVAGSIDAHTAELQESESARTRAVKASVTRLVGPLTSALEESTAQTSGALGLLGRKLDRLSAAVEKSGTATKPAAAKPAATKPATAKPAAAKPAATKRARKTAPTREARPPVGAPDQS